MDDPTGKAKGGIVAGDMPYNARKTKANRR